MAAASPPMWQQALQHAINLNRSARHAKHVQLATVRPDGSPACRTIVFRGFDPDFQLLFCTDARSQKAAEEIGRDPRAELCWYLTVTREQFRIRGVLSLVGAPGGEGDAAQQAQRIRVWKGMSNPAREQFGWPHPGQPRPSSGPLYDGETLDESAPPLATFCLLTLEPEEVDHLQLKGNRRYIYRLEKDEVSAARKWTKEEVNP